MDDLFTKDETRRLHEQVRGLRQGASCPDGASPLDRLAYFALHVLEVVFEKALAEFPPDPPAEQSEAGA